MTSIKEKRLDIRIEGRVQGVGFRQWVYRQAEGLGVRGWVRNTPRGAVEVRMRGAADNVAKLRTACAKGPFLSRVERVFELPETETADWPATDSNYFEILPTS